MRYNIRMATSVELQRTGDSRGASRWTTLAVVLVVGGAWQVGIWANHWYIGERFYAGGVDATPLFRSANQAMVTGLVCFGLATVCILVGRALHRRGR